MTLLYPYFLIPAAACLALFALLRLRSSFGSWAVVLSPEVFRYLAPGGGAKARDWSLLALAAIFAALSSPAIRTEASAYQPSEGLILIVDVSRSMTLTDVRPSRLAAAKSAVLAVSEAMPTTPAALIVYAGDAFLAQPFSVDRSQLTAFVGALEHGLIPVEGSAMERALALAQSVLRQSGLASARLVLFSDGGGVGADAQDAAWQIKLLGGRIDALRFALAGTEEPEPFDRNALEELARLTGGMVAEADALGGVDLAELDLTASGAGFTTLDIRTEDWRNQSHFLLLLALPLMLLLFRRGEA